MQVLWNANCIPITILLEYYTPKSTKKQEHLCDITIFVNYDNILCQHRYVNKCNHLHITLCIFQLLFKILEILLRFTTKYRFCKISFNIS